MYCGNLSSGNYYCGNLSFDNLYLGNLSTDNFYYENLLYGVNELKLIGRKQERELTHRKEGDPHSSTDSNLHSEVKQLRCFC